VLRSKLAASLSGLIARSLVLCAPLLASGCWGYPKLAIRTAGAPADQQFRFSYCKRSKAPPPLLAITVSDVDRNGAAVSPPVCRLVLKGNEAPGRVDTWKYGEATPTLELERCQPLRPDRVYRISIGGGGDGTALFRTDSKAQLIDVGDSC
jgi:hypothetical protein